MSSFQLLFDPLQKTPHKQSPLASILINVIFPVLILDYCSEGNINPLIRADGQSFWKIGPLWAMILALALPIGYAIKTIITHKKFDLLSGVGIGGVVLTGIISMFVIGEGGSIHASTPWLFSTKEALIPLVLATAILVSASTPTPLLNTFIYTPEIFDIRRIEQSVREQNKEDGYKRLLTQSTWILTGSLVGSSVGNFFLALSFMTPVLLFPENQQQVEYNLAVGRITWWGFLIIGIPLMAALLVILSRLIKTLGKLTGLPKDKILLR